jgi:hypothetical protein
MRRQISVPAITFSGGGWYAEGYSHAQPAAKAEKAEKAGKPCGAGEAAPQGACCDGCPAKKQQASD